VTAVQAPERAPEQRPAWASPVITIAAAVVLALVASLLAASFSGALTPQILGDPGIVVRWSLVLGRVLTDLAASLTVGALLLAALALPVTGRTEVYRPALVLAAVSATVWAFTGLFLLVVTYLEISGQPISDPDFGAQLVAFARDVQTGRLLAITSAAAAVIGLVAAGVTRLWAAGLLAVGALAALIPSALAGHANTDTGHETAVTALGLHLLGVTVWVGGLAALLILGSGLPAAASGSATRRYSALAGWAYGAVALSGVLSAWQRLPSYADLGGSRYGMIILAKVLALGLLGIAGGWHRQHTLTAMDAGAPRAFARLAGAELALMGLAVGLAVALARTAPPASPSADQPLDPTVALTGYPMPDAPTLSRWLFSWQPDLLWLVIAGLALFGYLGGVRRLRRRGDRWPVNRTIWFVAGIALLVYVTSGAPAMYGRVTFSGHMVGHMLLAMVVPVPLVLSAPFTLALRAVHARTDGTRGPREWLLAALGSPVTKVLAFPPVAGLLFTGSLIVFYYSGLFGQALTTHVGHELMHVHFLITGYLFAWVLVGVDPGPARWNFPMRLVVLLATMGFHAFFGIALLTGTSVIQESYFGQLTRTWGRDLLADQQLGGGLAWGIGEFPTFLLALILVIQWSRADDREAARLDRAADRDGDADLNAYNEMLSRMARDDR
jgi:cytochrome c oxidase assembly factor CtaG/putative copper export protein